MNSEKSYLVFFYCELALTLNFGFFRATTQQPLIITMFARLYAGDCHRYLLLPL